MTVEQFAAVWIGAHAALLILLIVRKLFSHGGI